MDDIRLSNAESRFADIIWDNEPVSSGELVKMAADTLGWKKSTTYTILRRLCDKGVFKSEDAIVTSLISKEELAVMQSEKFVEDTFFGSLPAFLTAFTKRRKLSDDEIKELEDLIEKMRR